MTTWIATPAHFTAPCPSAGERAAFALGGGITERHVTNWFSNARKRSWKARAMHEQNLFCEDSFDFVLATV